jgi:hypothetical protein
MERINCASSSSQFLRYTHSYAHFPCFLSYSILHLLHLKSNQIQSINIHIHIYPGHSYPAPDLLSLVLPTTWHEDAWDDMYSDGHDDAAADQPDNTNTNTNTSNNQDDDASERSGEDSDDMRAPPPHAATPFTNTNTNTNTNAANMSKLSRADILKKLITDSRGPPPLSRINTTTINVSTPHQQLKRSNTTNNNSQNALSEAEKQFRARTVLSPTGAAGKA